MIFSNRHTNPTISLEVDGIKVDRVKAVTFLGVIIDKGITGIGTWKSHFNIINKK